MDWATIAGLMGLVGIITGVFMTLFIQWITDRRGY